jgi:hypothetical protein
MKNHRIFQSTHTCYFPDSKLILTMNQNEKRDRRAYKREQAKQVMKPWLRTTHSNQRSQRAKKEILTAKNTVTQEKADLHQTRDTNYWKLSETAITIKAFLELTSGNKLRTRRSVRLASIVTPQHERHNCTTHRFDITLQNSRGNQAYCRYCYCYVCEQSPALCMYWAYHSEASADDPFWALWRDYRKGGRMQR